MNETDKGVEASGASAKARAMPALARAPGADAAVVEALRRGDEEAFTRLVDQHHETLRRIARSYVPSAAVADEVVQDTWLAVIQGIWAFEGRSSLRTWILRILINRARTRALREGRMVPLFDPETSDSEALEGPAAAARLTGTHESGPSPEACLLTEESRVLLRAAIDTLPASQRVVLTMRDLAGYSSEEVCNALGLSETNQRVILHRARSKVRSKLTAHFGRE
jgi:RNA polymerase sigma-70 factor (ECF subfamily)